jgi:hypothetical protein
VAEEHCLKARLNLTVVHVLANPPAGWTSEQGFINTEVSVICRAVCRSRVLHLRAQRDDGRD